MRKKYAMRGVGFRLLLMIEIEHMFCYNTFNPDDVGLKP